jgi:acyl-coenzyme A synthetase/AMP-(fatty) acid ligase/acyl carrier protein
LNSMRERPGLTAKDTLLAITTLSFDIAGLELLLPLVVGAKVVVAPRDTVLDGNRLAAQLKECGATVMQATPATWRLLLEAGWAGDPQLKILCGGEAWPPELAQELLPRCASLWNMYGPTETTIWSAVSKIEPGQPVLIGGPIANTQLYLLDGHLQPVPIGVPGELYIGGDGLARGYLNRPELTAEKFIRDPFLPKPSARLYRTGDLARYRADGRIEFLGRADHQIKIRGYRVELGEIEAALRQHPGVGEAVVVARETSPGDKRLVAYVIAKTRPAPTDSELRHFLQELLPSYMMPAAFVNLEAFPLTPNGKVDRRVLPAPEAVRLDLEEAFVAPRTAVEKKLAEIWCSLLGVKEVGVNDNFYSLGGHSLLATQVISQIRVAFQTEVSLRNLFESPTVAGLSAVIEKLKGQAAGPAMPALVALPRKTPRPPAAPPR